MAGYRKAILKRFNQVRWQYFRDEPASVAKAAKHLNLDPTRAGDREQLLYILAEAVFAPGKRGRKAGARTYWHNVRLFNLGRLYSIEKEKSPRLKDAAIARRITKHPNFKNDDPDQIRVRLPWAHQLFQESCENAWFGIAAEIAAEYVAEHGEPDEFDEPPEYDF